MNQTPLTLTQANKLAQELTAGEVTIDATRLEVLARRNGFKFVVRFPKRYLSAMGVREYLENWQEWPPNDWC